jgi:hypothetical protein
LIMSPVNAIGEIACRFRDADDGSFHKIRLSYVMHECEGLESDDPAGARNSRSHGRNW